MVAMINKSVARLGVIVIISLFFTLALLTPSGGNAQITSSYGSNTGLYPVAFTLTVNSPNQNTNYFGNMLLNFSVIWTDFPNISPFEFVSDAPVTAYYYYALDNNPLVSIIANQTFITKDFYALPSFSYNLDISKLANGFHQITVIVQMYYLYNGQPSSLLINQTTSPVDFLVQNSETPIPSPTIPEFPWLMILPLFLSILSIAVLIRSRKPWKVTQH
jgi:hypothetical protein